MSRRIEFRLGRGPAGVPELVPFVDGTSLVELVGRYEAERGYRPSAGYAGIAPDLYDFGDLRRYFLGEEDGSWRDDGDAWLLGCNCGEVGCWPLAVRITVSADTVGWNHFAQPHRDDWNYDGLGPFVFDRDEYVRVVSSVVEQYDAERGEGERQ